MTHGSMGIDAVMTQAGNTAMLQCTPPGNASPDV